MADIIQATTPTFVISLPNAVDLTAARTIEFSLRQYRTVISKTDVTLDGTHTVRVGLTQRESLGFTAGEAELQLNWVYEDGSRGAIYKIKINILDNLVKRVIE